jgi:hypothetical protein
MAILNYTTTIKAEKTIMEIQRILVNHGATKIVTDYSKGIPISVTFCVELKGQIIGFSLPARYQGVLHAMRNNKKVPRRLVNDEQAVRVSWRIIKDWVEAQMALVEAELADLAEVFLPYAITKEGKTLYSQIDTNKLLMIE